MATSGVTRTLVEKKFVPAVTRRVIAADFPENENFEHEIVDELESFVSLRQTPHWNPFCKTLIKKWNIWKEKNWTKWNQLRKTFRIENLLWNWQRRKIIFNFLHLNSVKLIRIKDNFEHEIKVKCLCNSVMMKWRCFYFLMENIFYRKFYGRFQKKIPNNFFTFYIPS